MRSQLITIMAEEDEAAFLRFVFERPTTYLIPEVRSPSPDIRHSRDVAASKSLTCMLWDKEILAQPQVEYIPSCNDSYLRSDESLIQFLRSPAKEGTIGAGRIALATNWKGASETNPRTATAMKRWYNSLARWIKSNFKNSFVYASDFKPEVGGRSRMVWAGPRAIELSAQGVKLKHNGPAEFSLHYVDPANEERILAKYRAPRSFIGVGRVTRAGDVVDKMLRKRVFGVALDGEAPLSRFEGPFMYSTPEPKVGDEVACVFDENIFGRHAEPWEPREIKKLTQKNRERVLESLRTALHP